MRWILVGLALSWCVALRAQTLTPSFSLPVKTARSIDRIEIVATDDAGFHVLEIEQGKSPSLHLSRIDTTMKEVWRKDFPIPVIEGCIQRYEGWIPFEDHFILITTGYNAERNKYYAFGTFIQLDGTIQGNSVLMNVLDTENDRYRHKLNYKVSPDRSKLLCFFSPFDKEEKQALGLRVYTKELELLYERDLSLPEDEGVVDVHHYAIDNQGGVYLMSGMNPEKSAADFQKAQMGKYMIYYYNFESNKLKQYDVSLKEKQVISVAFDQRKNGNLVIGGYYSNDLSTSVAGTFIFELESGAEKIATASYTAFSKDFLGRFLNERELRKEKSLTDLYLDRIVLDTDSTAVLIGEEYYITEQIMPDLSTGRQVIQNIYHFDNIIATRYSASGQQDWSVKIPKRQYAYYNDKSCSYALFVGAKGIEVYFNDDDDNTGLTGPQSQGDAESWHSASRGVVTGIVLSADGEIQRQVLSWPEKYKGVLKPPLSSQDIRGEVILGYEDTKTYRFGRLPRR